MAQDSSISYKYDKSLELYQRAAQVIPEGIYGHQNPAFVIPGASPYFAAKAKGAHFWDVDGNRYIDFLCGYGPVILGHNHPEIEKAVQDEARKGICFNHPGSIMVELAEYLTEKIDIADWAVFAKNGSDVTTWVIRVAREYTGRKKIIMIKGAYHGTDAWCSAYPGGVLPEERNLVLKMTWNNAGEMESLVSTHKNQIAALVITPYHHPTYTEQQMPSPVFIDRIRKICDREGIVLIVDDIRAGFRLDIRGSHHFFGIRPDMICFSKAMANGHPISTAVGRNFLREASEAVFFAGTYWFSTPPMAAAMKTLEIIESTDAIARMRSLGERLAKGLQDTAARHGYKVTISGPPALPYMTFDNDPDLYHMQVFCREMIGRGIFLHPHHNWFICAAHTDEDIDMAVSMADEAFGVTARELDW